MIADYKNFEYRYARRDKCLPKDNGVGESFKYG